MAPARTVLQTRFAVCGDHNHVKHGVVHRWRTSTSAHKTKYAQYLQMLLGKLRGISRDCPEWQNEGRIN